MPLIKRSYMAFYGASEMRVKEFVIVHRRILFYLILSNLISCQRGVSLRKDMRLGSFKTLWNVR